jgi:hypothetical protein
MSSAPIRFVIASFKDRWTNVRKSLTLIRRSLVLTTLSGRFPALARRSYSACSSPSDGPKGWSLINRLSGSLPSTVLRLPTLASFSLVAFSGTTLASLTVVSSPSSSYARHGKESRLGTGFIYFSLINMGPSASSSNRTRAPPLPVLISKPILLSSMPRASNYSREGTDRSKTLISLSF